MAHHIETVIEILNKPEIMNKLSWLYKHNVSGFEKWLQFELAYWMENEYNHSVYFEHQVKPDQRKTDKTKYQIDLVTREKGAAKSLLHAIELKVTRKENGAVRKAIKDLLRLANVKSSEWNFRSVTAVALCAGLENRKQTYDLLLTTLQKKNKGEWLFGKHPIPDTDAVLYFFGWRVRPGKVDREHFKNFLNEILKTANELGLESFNKKTKATV